ncbi:MAG: hypothetical protein HYZ42_13865 [Bacteroidetes bacterium]|nr:hypothetical protein [Bacteroidota bacterium]
MAKFIRVNQLLYSLGYTSLCLLLFLLVPSISKASHLMGGDFTYTFVSKSGNTMTYKVSMKLYRDCSSNSQFPATATIGIYYANNNSSYGSLQLSRASGYSTEKSITPTCIPVSGLCIAEMLYENTISLPANNTTGYYLSAEACCRNGSINNISNPSGTGMGWKLYIPPPNSTLFNNSVNFSSKPLPFICVGDTISFNHLAYDSDGDSLVYSLVVPYKSAGAGGGGIAAASPSLGTITYAGGTYSTSYPLGTDSYIDINSETGEIRIYAGSAKVAVVSVEVKEYRKNSNGSYTYVGAVRRDLQIISRTCNNYSPPIFKIPSNISSTNYYNRTVTALDTLCFDITGVDTLGDSLYLSSAGAIFDGTDGLCSPYAILDADTADSVITKKFCWSPGCCRAGNTYVFTVNISDNNCGTRQKTFTIKVNASAAATAPQLRCVSVQSNTSIALTWLPSVFTKHTQRYYIFRRTTSSFVKIDSVNVGTNSYTDNNVTNAYSTQYQYMIKSANMCDTLSIGDTATAIKVSVTKPTNFKAAVTWTYPKTSFRPTYYKIYRNVSGGGWQLVDSTRKDTFFYYTPRCFDSLQFKVIAVDSVAGCQSQSMLSNSVTLEDLMPPLIMGFKRATIDYTNTLRLDFKRNDSLDTKNIIYIRKT